jgi:hypothetical protein
VDISLSCQRWLTISLPAKRLNAIGCWRRNVSEVRRPDLLFDRAFEALAVGRELLSHTLWVAKDPLEVAIVSKEKSTVIRFTTLLPHREYRRSWQ